MALICTWEDAGVIFFAGSTFLHARQHCSQENIFYFLPTILTFLLAILTFTHYISFFRARDIESPISVTDGGGGGVGVWSKIEQMLYISETVRLTN